MRKIGYKKSEESRRQVLDAAIARIADKGIAGASVQEIADHAGLSKGAVHYHFDSKDELLAQVLDRVVTTLADQVQRTFDEPGEPLERVWRAISEMWRLRRDGTQEARVLGEFYVLARQSESIRKTLENALAKERVRITEAGFLPLIEQGLKPKVSIVAAVRLLLGTLDGLALHHAISPMSKSEEEKVLSALHITMVAVFEV